ncbi:MAG: carboxypeptidase regulatory-like domain-containing protein [Reyranella sp.]|nr:carboxypeptidase regulatory-like domain-containing protein [Reyranella sp.]
MLVLLLSLLLAQEPHTIAAPRVEGRVVDAATGKAIAEAKITVCYEDRSEDFKGNTAETGESGYFAIVVPERIPFHLAIEKQGYVSQGDHAGKRPESRSYFMKDFDKHAGVTYRLEKQKAK